MCKILLVSHSNHLGSGKYWLPFITFIFYPKNIPPKEFCKLYLERRWLSESLTLWDSNARCSEIANKGVPNVKVTTSTGLVQPLVGEAGAGSSGRQGQRGPLNLVSVLDCWSSAPDCRGYKNRCCAWFDPKVVVCYCVQSPRSHY